MIATVTLGTGQSVKLGAILPVRSFTYGRLLVKEYADGRQKISVRLGPFYDTALDTVSPPTSTNWRASAGASLSRMYLNDTYGDCVIAGKYHSVGIWTANETGTPVQGTDNEVLTAYHTICGRGDNGCVITDVLDAFKTNGLSFNGQIHKIDDYVSVDWTNKLLCQVAIELFGTITLGIDLPSAWTSGGDGSTWDVTSSRSVGGHDVPAIDYDANGVWIATWGGTRLMTWPAFQSKRYITEAEVPLSPDWYSKGNLAPNGIAVASLKDALLKVGQGQIPDITPPPPDVLDWWA